MASNLEIFNSLFKGRSDVFATRWERNGKSGYMPAYILDWDQYKLHKAKGGTLKDFTNKQYAPLTEKRILNHLEGKEILGIYPLLQDNTSWFIAADFDQSIAKSKLWMDECRAFILECEKHDLPVYLERSRSGTGGHVWMFFEEPYPAYKSRFLFIHLLKSCGIISEGDKTSNFDRLFPNQDSHSGRGLGNLIALPLQKKAMANGNTYFIQTENLNTFTDQWMFLGTIQKVTPKKLDELYDAIIVNKQHNSVNNQITIHSPNSAFPIILTNEIVLPRHGLPPLLLKYLKDNFNFMNVDYLVKKQAGKSTYGTQMYFKTVEEKENTIVMPRGVIGGLIKYCNDQKIAYQLEDKRTKLEDVNFTSSIPLYDYQQEAVEIIVKRSWRCLSHLQGHGKR
ncbi:MAG: hypothetical protein WKF97_06105 [Chitinophagaceae bacterium]